MQTLDAHAKGAGFARVQRSAAQRRPPRLARTAVVVAVSSSWSAGSHTSLPQQQRMPAPQLQQRTSGASSSNGASLQPSGPQSPFSAVGPAVKAARVRFWLKFHVDYGQSLRVIGGAEPLGAWNLSRSARMAWSDGDLWNVTLDLVPGQVYEYKYVIVDHSGVNAVDWQRGGNNVLALQAADSEVEVYDNWRNQPGAMVVVDGSETTRERKLLSWAGELSAQRAELRQYKADLTMAREQIRMLRAEVGVMQSELSQADVERQQAEQRAAAAESNYAALKLQLAGTQAQTRSTMEEAVRLLSALDSPEPPSSSPSSPTPPPAASSSSNGPSRSSEAPATAGSSSSSSSSSSGGGFGSFFGGFGGRGGSGGPAASSNGAAVAAAAAIAAAASGGGPAGAASAVGQ